MALKNDNDHWAFLEEIEAPMWVDLAIEAEYKSQDSDDEWFHRSHRFHQLSSCQLKSMLSQSGEVSTILDGDLQGPSSPKLVSSVSRSRGKDYRSKRWRDNCDLSVNKPHLVKVINKKSSLAGSGPCEKIKHKLSFINAKGTSTSKTSLLFERKSTANAKANCTKPIFTGGVVVESMSSSVTDKACESNTSIVTSEGIQQQQWKNMGVSNQTYGNTSGLLSAVKITLRKSYTTRPASRVEINGNRRQSRDRKSSASKSSVGSSSNPDHHSKGRASTSRRSKEGTPDSRNLTKKSEPAENNAKVSNMCRTSIVKVREGIVNSRKVGISNVAKSSRQELAKSKVQYQNPRAKTLLPCKEKKQDLSTDATKAGEKMRVGGPNRMTRAGKENATGGISSSQKRNGIDTAAGVIVRSQKWPKQNVPQKGHRTGFVAPKGKISGRSEGENPTNSIQRVYLR